MKKYPNWNDVLQSKNEYDDLFDNPDSPKIPYQKKEAQANQISKPLPIKEQNKKEPLVQDGNRLISENWISQNRCLKITIFQHLFIINLRKKVVFYLNFYFSFFFFMVRFI